VLKKKRAMEKRNKKRSNPQTTRSQPKKKNPTETRDQISSVTRPSDYGASAPSIDELDIVPFQESRVTNPQDEWLVLEIPRKEDALLGIPRPCPVAGPQFVPEGSHDMQAVLFLKVMGCFAYTMERADLIYHGQVQTSEKEEIELRCSKYNIPFLSVTPGGMLWTGFGVCVAGPSSLAYTKSFHGLLLDADVICNYLKNRDRDTERGAQQITLGTSTLNYEHHQKTPAELEQRLLDFPSLSGTAEDFTVLGPQIRDIVDRLQDFEDLLHRKEQKQMANPLRYELFASKLNEAIGCARNRNETVTVSLTHLDPRTNALIRHVDHNNDYRHGATVTAIWSAVLPDVVWLEDDGKHALIRLSIIVYTRKNAGEYTERTGGYVATFLTRIDWLLATPHYECASRYAELSLSECYKLNEFKDVCVWASDSPDATLKCLVKPMFFDPCAHLSPFAWCISRWRNAFSLSRNQVVELVYLCAVQSSVLPFVWLTGKLLQENPKIHREKLKTTSVCRYWHEETSNRASRAGGIGGNYQRHQVCLTHPPGMVSASDKSFSSDSEAKLKAQMRALEDIIDGVADPRSAMNGPMALRQMKDGIDFLGDLNSLKVLPLAALVGLFDIKSCFKDALYGECPKGEPHGVALKDLGCDTIHQQQKFIQGLNEYFGQPREYFFHGDHVLCMSQGVHLHPQKRKWDVFFPEMPLLRFAHDTNSRTVNIEWKPYGTKEWKTYQPFLDTQKSP